MKNRIVGMRTRHIEICHRFLRNMVEDKEIYIKYIRSKEKLGILLQRVFLNQIT